MPASFFIRAFSGLCPACARALRRWPVLLCLLLGAFPCAAQQASPFIVDSYDELSGLLSNETYDLHYDRQGFLWIAHNNGLSRFDGQHFYTYRLPEAWQEPNASVKLFGDAAGSIYLMTTRLVLQFTGESARPFRVVASLPAGVRFRDVLLLPGGEGYLGTSNGLYLLDGARTKARLAAEKDEIMGIAADSAGYCYVFTAKETLVLLQGHIVGRLSLIAGTAPTGAGIGGPLWCPSGGRLYRLSAGRITDSLIIPDRDAYFNRQLLYYSASNQTLFLTHGHKLYCLRPGKDWEPLQSFSDEIMALTGDAAGNVFFAVESNGLRQAHFTRYEPYPFSFIKTGFEQRGEIALFEQDGRLPAGAPKEVLRYAYSPADSSHWYETKNGYYRQ